MGNLAKQVHCFCKTTLSFQSGQWHWLDQLAGPLKTRTKWSNKTFCVAWILRVRRKSVGHKENCTLVQWYADVDEHCTFDSEGSVAPFDRIAGTAMCLFVFLDRWFRWIKSQSRHRKLFETAWPKARMTLITWLDQEKAVWFERSVPANKVWHIPICATRQGFDGENHRSSEASDRCSHEGMNPGMLSLGSWALWV